MMDISLSTRSGASDVPDAGWLQEEMIYVVRRMHTCTQSPRAGTEGDDGATPLAIIDCLEFSTEFRTLDTADELGFLALECERLHAPDFVPYLR